jgi:hypothetical protein
MTTIIIYIILCVLNGVAVTFGASMIGYTLPSDFLYILIAITGACTLILFLGMMALDKIQLPWVNSELAAARNQIELTKRQLAASNEQIEALRTDIQSLRADLERANQRPVLAKEIGKEVVDEIVAGKIDSILQKAQTMMSDHERMNGLIKKNTELRDIISQWEAYAKGQEETITAKETEIKTLKTGDQKHLNAVIRQRQIIEAMDRLSVINGLTPGFLKKNAEAHVDGKRRSEQDEAREKASPRKGSGFIPSKPYKKMDDLEYATAKVKKKRGY